MNIKNIIKEEMDWIDNFKTETEIKVDTTRDYMGIWEHFENMLSELGIPWIEGDVRSDDYSGDSWMRVKTQYFEFDIEIQMRYEEERGDSRIYWSIYHTSGWTKDRDTGEYYPPGGPWVIPVVDEFKKKIIPIITRQIKYGH